MKLLFFTNIKSNNIVQKQTQSQPLTQSLTRSLTQSQTQQFKLVGNTTRKCASLKIQGNLRCSSCSGK
jgi:hypothetical protein